MVTIRIKETGEVRQVERNIAHELIDSGVAELVKSNTQQGYATRQVRAEVRTTRNKPFKAKHK